jgi:hypothetical protein
VLRSSGRRGAEALRVEVHGRHDKTEVESLAWVESTALRCGRSPRPTISPFWTHVIDVGHVNEASIDLSKDNVVFGVRW